jgi:membrane dipeptidase
MPRAAMLLPVLLLLAGFEKAPDAAGRAARLHAASLVIDTSIAVHLLFRPDFATEHAGWQYDLPKARRGGVTAAVLMPGTEELFVADPRLGTSAPAPRGAKVMEFVFRGPDEVKRVLLEIDAAHRLVEANPRALAIARRAADLEAAKRDGQLAFILGLKAATIDRDLGVLRTYHRLGMRVLALCHGPSLGWVSSSREIPAGGGGLDAFGREVVRECNRIGMVIDVSHAADASFWDTVASTKAPILASHSGARALVDQQRNLTDDMIRAVAKSGGVIGVPTVDSFVDVGAARRWATDFDPDAYLRSHLALRAKYKDAWELMRALRSPGVGRGPAKPEVHATPLARMLDQIDYMVKLVGVDHVGIGTDFDGGAGLAGFDNAAEFPNVTRSLVERGYSDEAVGKILGGNFLRLFRAVAG